MSQPAPTASGTLVSTPLANVLIYALDRRLTGTLVLEEPGGTKHAVYFVAGAPQLAGLSVPFAPLGELAVESGALARERLEPALAAAREAQTPLGRVLVDWGVLDEERLERLLEEQVARRVRKLADLPPQSAYGYYAGTNFLEGVAGPAAPCAPLALIWRLMKAKSEEERTREVVQRLGTAPLRFHQEAQLAHFQFDPRERAVVDVLAAKPQSLAELKARGLMDPQRVEELVALLALLRHFETGSGASPVGAEPRASRLPQARPSALPQTPEPVRAAPAPVITSHPPAPPPRLATPAPQAPAPAPAATPAPAAAPTPAPAPAARVDDDFRRELKERAEATGLSYYELLGVPNDAPNAAIASAFFALAKRWHPDRLGPDNADLRDLAERVFARIAEAHQVLSDAERRKQYDELVKTGEGAADEQEQVQRLVRAATNFQKAQVLLRRNNLPAAEEAARAALADAPDEADHIALVAWLESNKPGADLKAVYKEIDRAARLEYQNLRVRWYRGQLLKRLGRGYAALEDFRFIVEKDPRNVDAQREIRLQEMARSGSGDAPGAGKARATLSPDAPEKPGFLGKLFKK
jgi:curved DNA-binding protein CbpA